MLTEAKHLIRSIQVSLIAGVIIYLFLPAIAPGSNGSFYTAVQQYPFYAVGGFMILWLSLYIVFWLAWRPAKKPTGIMN